MKKVKFWIDQQYFETFKNKHNTMRCPIILSFKGKGDVINGIFERKDFCVGFDTYFYKNIFFETYFDLKIVPNEKILIGKTIYRVKEVQKFKTKGFKKCNYWLISKKYY